MMKTCPFDTEQERKRFAGKLASLKYRQTDSEFPNSGEYYLSLPTATEADFNSPTKYLLTFSEREGEDIPFP